MNRNLEIGRSFTSQGVGGNWRMRREMMSSGYTTRWQELPKAQ
ncbi:MAG: DUF4113 domain-containing protein [Planctomycetes bacterium]|nr:DUF4113 domain-containing protein [Planctomycetota bacterium]